MNLVFERFNSIKDFTIHSSVSAAADDGVTAQQKFLQCQQFEPVSSFPDASSLLAASSLPDASYFQKVLQFRLIFSHQNISNLYYSKVMQKNEKVIYRYNKPKMEH